MQEQNIEMIRSQPLETALDRGENVFFRKIEEALANPDIGLEDHAVAEARCHIDRFGKLFLRPAAAIDIGMVEKSDTCVQRRVDQRRNILIGQTSNPHTTKCNFGSVQVGACDFDRIHLLSLILKITFGDCVLTYYSVD